MVSAAGQWYRHQTYAAVRHDLEAGEPVQGRIGGGVDDGGAFVAGLPAARGLPLTVGQDREELAVRTRRHPAQDQVQGSTPRLLRETYLRVNPGRGVRRGDAGTQGGRAVIGGSAAHSKQSCHGRGHDDERRCGGEQAAPSSLRQPAPGQLEQSALQELTVRLRLAVLEMLEVRLVQRPEQTRKPARPASSSRQPEQPRRRSPTSARSVEDRAPSTYAPRDVSAASGSLIRSILAPASPAAVPRSA